MCSGRVHASKRSCGERRKKHVKRISVSEGRVTVTSMFPFASMFPVLLRLQRRKIVIEPIHTLFPKKAIVFHPGRNISKRSGVQTAGTPLRVAASRDEFG